MFQAGKLMLGVVGGGVLLGTALAGLAHPVPKAAPEAPWGQLGNTQIAYDPDYRYIEPLPEDLSPHSLPDGYAPAFASSELDLQWQADAIQPRFDDERLVPVHYMTAQAGDAVAPPTSMPNPAEQAAQAEDAADEARQAEAPAADQPGASAGEPHFIQVAAAFSGELY
jgi:hypothetical protein